MDAAGRVGASLGSRVAEVMNPLLPTLLSVCLAVAMPPLTRTISPAPGNPAQRNQRPAPTTSELKEMFNRPPPASIEAEMSLLGALLIEPSRLDDARRILGTSDAFYDQRHKAIFDAMVFTVEEFGTMDLVILADRLRGKSALEEVGGIGYLLKIASECISAAHLRYYACLVREKHDLRKMIDAAGTGIYEAYNHSDLGENGARQVMERSEQRITQIIAAANFDDRPEEASSIAARVCRAATDDEADRGPCFSTGYWEIDRGIGGFRPGDLVVLAARPGSGKTALALSMAAKMCGGPHKAVGLFVSRETSKDRLMHRLLAIESGVPAKLIRDGKLDGRQRNELETAASRIGEIPLKIDDRSMKTVADIDGGLRSLRARHAVDVVFVDYLQIVGPPPGKYLGTEEKVSVVSTALKRIAVDHQVAVVCLAQLNREMLKRGETDQRPRISDLRGSGQIEQDADVIGLMHRPWIHLSPEQRAENEWNAGTTFIYFDKVRDAAPFKAVLSLNGPTCKFSSVASAEHPEEELPF